MLRIGIGLGLGLVRVNACATQCECVSECCHAIDWHPIWGEVFQLIPSIPRVGCGSTITLTRLSQLVKVGGIMVLNYNSHQPQHMT